MHPRALAPRAPRTPVPAEGSEHLTFLQLPRLQSCVKPLGKKSPVNKAPQGPTRRPVLR